MTSPSNEQQTTIDQAIASHADRPGPLLPILHDIQKTLRYIPEQAIEPIATALNLSRAEVHGVISFYHSFTDKPLGKQVIEVCRAESCQAMGGREIEAKFKQALGIGYGETTSDGEISLEPVFCLGHCACSPSVRVGEKMYSRLSADSVEHILNEIKERAA